jgi:AP-1 complex subunit beta-1
VQHTTRAVALQDQDPYVRKTAAICVAKLHDMSPELAKDRGFLGMLRDMTSDANPMVVSNAVAALSEIYDMSGGEVFVITHATSNYLLTAMEQCTEWGQVCRHPSPSSGSHHSGLLQR